MPQRACVRSGHGALCKGDGSPCQLCAHRDGDSGRASLAHRTQSAPRLFIALWVCVRQKSCSPHTDTPHGVARKPVDARRARRARAARLRRRPRRRRPPAVPAHLWRQHGRRARRHDAAAAAHALAFSMQLLAELCCAIYLIDLVSGILHATLDYCGTDRARLVVVDSKAAAPHAATDARYSAAGRGSSWWNFQQHHARPFRARRSAQGAVVARDADSACHARAVRRLAGLAPCPARVWCSCSASATGVQASHFAAHQRVHRGRASLPPLIAWLQDARLLLHPSVHQRHHETFDVNCMPPQACPDALALNGPLTALCSPRQSASSTGRANRC